LKRLDITIQTTYGSCEGAVLRLVNPKGCLLTYYILKYKDSEAKGREKSRIFIFKQINRFPSGIKKIKNDENKIISSFISLSDVSMRSKTHSLPNICIIQLILIRLMLDQRESMNVFILHRAQWVGLDGAPIKIQYLSIPP
jgi:hypothetical protein